MKIVKVKKYNEKEDKESIVNNIDDKELLELLIKN